MCGVYGGYAFSAHACPWLWSCADVRSKRSCFFLQHLSYSLGWRLRLSQMQFFKLALQGSPLCKFLR